MTKSMWSTKPVSARKGSAFPGLKKEIKVSQVKKVSKLQGQKGASESLRSGEHGSTKDAAKKC